MNKPKTRGRSRRPRSVTPKKKLTKNIKKKVVIGSNERKAPEQSATKFEDGTIMLGQDNNYYVIARRNNDSLYWQRTRETLDRSALNNLVGDHKVLIGAIQDMDYTKPALTLNITDKFYQLLCKKPKIIRCVESNGFCFGKLFNKDYICIGALEDLYLLVGILDVDKDMTEEDIFNLHNDQLWKKAYDTQKVKYYSNFDSRDGLKNAKKLISDKVLFTGQILNKDIGMHVLVHITNNAIDSLIIDSDCVFPYTKRDNINRY